LTNEPAPNPVLRSWFYRCCQVICRFVTTVFFDLKVSGTEHMPKTGGVLLLSNHQSYLDPVMIGVQLRRPLSYLGKSELFVNPFLSWIFRRLNAISLKQGAGDIHALRETIRLLKEGHILTIFPEGSRTIDGEIAALQPGFALVVRKAGVPIVPVVLNGSFAAWRRGKKIFKPWPIRVKFGPAINVQGLKPDEMIPLIDRTLRELFKELREEYPEIKPQISQIAQIQKKPIFKSV
jgi:1-acyl-sn-glycerol-3-phosphate acyltransferase